jgi:hypothetical protein
MIVGLARGVRELFCGGLGGGLCSAISKKRSSNYGPRCGALRTRRRPPQLGIAPTCCDVVRGRAEQPLRWGIPSPDHGRAADGAAR